MVVVDNFLMVKRHLYSEFTNRKMAKAFGLMAH